MNAKTLSIGVLLLLSGVLGAACSKSQADTTQTGTESKTKSTCNKVSKTSKCDEYASLIGLEEPACKDLGGTFSTAACPTDNRLGTCKKANNDVTYYYATKADLTYTVETAKADCEDPITQGKFTPAPTAASAKASDASGPCDKLAAALCEGEPAKCAARKAWLDKAIATLPNGKAISPAEQLEGCKMVLADKQSLDGYRKMAKKAAK